MTVRTREPSRLPVRGTLAAILTVGGIALLLSFRPPAPPASGAGAAQLQEPAAIEELLAPRLAATDVLLDPAAESVAKTEEVALTAIGDPIEIPWGDVQVAITIEGDDIVGVETLAIPLGDRRSQRINERAEPVLRTQAIVMDRAEVDVVSGATYTSRAYAHSLQSALDQLGVG